MQTMNSGISTSSLQPPSQHRPIKMPTSGVGIPAKRKRKANWTEDESLLLVKLYKENVSVFKNSFNKTGVSNRIKKNTWECIARTLNKNFSSSNRTMREVTKRWFSILARSKMKLIQHKKHNCGTGEQ